ncbi:molybdopterin-dependent oxidoreductase [Crossiella sp. SN42]|uniref:molybdopterin-dependent oxidoreductase n=1 Tax=Crossiella sp. SN42 TaxID=2944808 RepID=UPI00207CBE64|nr:molybdopterin-dependent oxidoreductase [Crossiella sp. SN42]MCO1574558.1 molybdopterin-dependent oxidoreductase [Crossiella sp. SN42]
MRHGNKLPPGQRRVEGFPRFGTHLSRPAPPVPLDPLIEVRGAVTKEFDLPLASLSSLPRKEITADFHCVAGWSATGLRWEGVSFATFYRAVLEPALPTGTSITHLTFRGLDGWKATAAIEDLLAEDVLIAQNLNGRPLDSDHGAPVRLVSPSQYGYINVKHLAGIELLTAAPANTEGPLLRSHPRGRVWAEERHGLLPGRVVRPFYRALIRPIRFLSARGARDRQPERPRSSN